MTDPDLTDDAFLGGRLSILQPSAGFRSGLDAVLLAAAAAVTAGKGARVMDAGAGVGVVGLAIASRIPDAVVTLVERDAAMVDLARRNAERNGLADRVHIVAADIAAGGRSLHDPARPQGLDPASFDHVVSNPPYYSEGTGTPPARADRASAHQMPDDSLDRWIAFLATAAAANGGLTLIHRADALDRILAALEGRFGGIRLLPIHPREGANAVRIIVTAVKGSRAPLSIRSGLVLQDAEGRYLPRVEAVLRDGAPLFD